MTTPEREGEGRVWPSYDEPMLDPALTERAAIVKWLRDVKQGWLNRKALADAIEQGHHLNQGKE